MLPYTFVAIEGNIGAGKTTLSQLLARRLEANLILEQFTDNPFLPYFYENPQRYAFPVELFFMTERHKQLSEHFARPDLFKSLTIADYFFIKTLLFARNNLNEQEFRLFQRLFAVLNANFPKPDLLLYLHRPVPVLKKYIQERGRAIEQNMPENYLQCLQATYLEYFKQETDIPIVLLDLNDSDFVNCPQVFEDILSLLYQKHRPGLQYISLVRQ
ncbi:MAG: deoxynucleoside kinase [Saprospiraceae bacterium]|nr:deoxynucleoside kinase [Saprospiraceae bacterium]MDW8482947.1 deoxynucleoside kinase [Saprospiraceae bacterium]